MFSPDLLTEETAFAETLSLQSTLFQINDAHSAVVEYGINPTSLFLLCSTGLASVSFLNDRIATESITGPEAVSQELALESLVTAFKDKVAKWASKVLDLAKNTGKALLDKIKALGTKVLSLLADTKDGAVAKGKDLNTEVKAHPAKTVLAAVTAAAAVVGVVAFATGNLGMVLTASKIPTFLKTLAAMIGKIAWPFGKIVPQVVKDHKILVTVVGVPTITAAATLGTLGWANQSSSALAEKIRHVVDSIGAGWDKVKTKVAPIAASVGTMAKGIGTGTVAGFRAGNSVAKRNPTTVYHSSGNGERAVFGGILSLLFGATGAVVVGGAAVIVSVLHVLYHLIKSIVVGALELVAGSVRAVKNSRASKDVPEYV